MATSNSRYVTEGGEAGYEFPYDGETRTWSVKETESGKELSTGHKSMGQAFKSVMATEEVAEPATTEPAKAPAKRKRSPAKQTAN